MNARPLAAYGKLLPFLRPHVGAAVGAALLMVLGALMQLPAPLLTRYLFDRVIPQGNVRGLNIFVLWLVLLLLLGAGIGLLQTRFLLACRYGMERAMRNMALERLLKSRRSWGEAPASGYLLSRLDDDISRIQHLLLDPLLTLLLQGLTLVVGTALLLHLHPRMAFVTLATLPLFVVILGAFSKRLQALSARRQEAWAQFRGQLQEGLSQLPTLQACRLEQPFRERTANVCQEALDISQWAEFTQTVATTLTGLAAAALPLFILWYGGREILAGRFTLGGFLAFNTGIGYLFGPARALSALRLDLDAASASAERVLELLNLPSEDDTFGKEPMGPFQVLEGRDLAFHYPGGDGRGLEPLTFRLRRGESLAVVGETGCGKSTLARLLVGNAPLEEGHLWLNERDLHTWSLASIRQEIGYVPQEPDLLAGTLRENLAAFDPNPDPTWLEELLRRCALDELIERLPKGLDTTVQEAGSGLSGGEKQRLALGRALYRRPGLLILDEATSGMDPNTEARVLDGLLSLPWRPAILFITHRHHVLDRFDRVLEIPSPTVETPRRTEAALPIA